MEIKVTAKHVAKGERSNQLNCPLALAIKETTGYHVQVSHRETHYAVVDGFTDPDNPGKICWTWDLLWKNDFFVREVIEVFDNTGYMPEGTLVVSDNYATFKAKALEKIKPAPVCGG